MLLEGTVKNGRVLWGAPVFIVSSQTVWMTARNDAATSEFLRGEHENEMWRRDPRIINLYDKPLYNRRPVAPAAPTLGLGSALLSCATIVLATAGIFWTYDAIFHREPAFVPALAQVAPGPQPLRPILDVPVPDMTSAEVLRANEDVPSSLLAGRAEARVSQPLPVNTLSEAPPPKKKTVRTVIRVPRDADRAYASASAFFQPPPFGGW